MARTALLLLAASLAWTGAPRAASPAPAEDAFVQIVPRGTRGEAVAWAEFSVRCPLTGAHWTGGPDERFGPLPPGAAVEVSLVKATSQEGWLARDQSWGRGSLRPGLQTLDAPIDFDGWDFAVQDVQPRYTGGAPRPGDELTLDDWDEVEIAFPGRTIVMGRWGWAFPQRSPWIPRAQHDAPLTVTVRYPDGRVGKASYRVSSEQPRLTAVVPVQRPTPVQEAAAAWDLHVVLVSSDLRYRAKDMQGVLVNYEGENVFVGEAPANTIAIANIPAGQAAYVLAGGTLPDGRTATASTVCRYDPDADPDRDFVYTWVAVLDFGEAPAGTRPPPVGGRDEGGSGPAAGGTAGRAGSGGPSFDGLERTGRDVAGGRSGGLDAGDPPATAGRDPAATGGDTERIILTGYEPDGRGGVDPDHVVVVVQRPDGETTVLDGPAALAALHRRGFLEPGGLRLTARGRRGWETPFVDPSFERPATVADAGSDEEPAPPPVDLPERELTWLFEVRYPVVMPETPEREGTAIELHTWSGTQPAGAPGSDAALARATQELRDNMALYLPPGEDTWTDGVFLTDQGERKLGGWVRSFTVTPVAGPFEDSWDADQARTDREAALKGR